MAQAVQPGESYFSCGGLPCPMLKHSGQVFFTLPRSALIRGFGLNHLIHHRAHLCVYLRMNDVPLPGMYGPSGDENKGDITNIDLRGIKGHITNYGPRRLDS
jgi:hypothetical protein